MNETIDKVKLFFNTNKTLILIGFFTGLIIYVFKSKKKLETAKRRIRAQKQKQKTFNVINRLKRFR